jgi:hypothetical protein
MRRERGWIGAVILGLAWANGAANAFADDAKGPAIPAQNAPARQSFWQIVISPNFSPAVIADFYEEPDGSLSVIHRPAAGATVSDKEQLAPPPAPDNQGAAANRDGNGPATFAVNAFLDDEPAKAETKPDEAAADKAPAPALVPAPAPAPTEPMPMIGPAPASGPAWMPGARPSYVDAYFSIPFFRSEYNANPSYRHEAAMELLFGQLRPTVIHKYVPPPVVQRYDYITPYSYNLNGRGVSYNFFYPRPSVYRQY